MLLKNSNKSVKTKTTPQTKTNKEKQKTKKKTCTNSKGLVWFETEISFAVSRKKQNSCTDFKS